MLSLLFIFVSIERKESLKLLFPSLAIFSSDESSILDVNTFSVLLNTLRSTIHFSSLLIALLSDRAQAIES